jgi:two-component system OmpR family sensor kinase
MRRRPWSRLSVRIFVVSMATLLTIVLTIVSTHELRHGPMSVPRWPRGEFARVEVYVANTVAARTNDPEALARELTRARQELGLTVTIFDERGEIVSDASEDEPPQALSDKERAELSPEGTRLDHDLFALPLRSGYVLVRGELPLRRGPPRVRPPGEGPPPRLIGPGPVGPTERRPPGGPTLTFDLPLLLICFALASWLLARMIARPLERIAGAARAFGAGDFRARSDVRRGDEIGLLSRAFDEMAERITRLMAAQRELLASVSHELRTPLARMRVALDLAEEGDAESARQSLHDIDEDVAELEELVQDVLSLSRLETQGNDSAALARRADRVSLREVINKALGRFRATYPSREVVDQLPPEEGTWFLQGDAALLRRVFENLLENAHKYTPSEAPVRITLSREAGAALVTVQDRGVGIGTEDLPHVFEPFFRADRSRTRGTGGTGLGLALCKRVIDAHGGAITIESRVEEGTSVTVRLPLVG